MVRIVVCDLIARSSSGVSFEFRIGERLNDLTDPEVADRLACALETRAMTYAELLRHAFRTVRLTPAEAQVAFGLGLADIEECILEPARTAPVVALRLSAVLLTRQLEYAPAGWRLRDLAGVELNREAVLAVRGLEGTAAERAVGAFIRNPRPRQQGWD